jgi:hypothetical protein
MECSICRWIRNGGEGFCTIHGNAETAEQGKSKQEALDEVAKRMEHHCFLPQLKHPLFKNTVNCNIDTPCYSQDCDECREIVEGISTLEISFLGWIETNEGRFARWLASGRDSQTRKRSARGGNAGTQQSSSDTQDKTNGELDSNRAKLQRGKMRESSGSSVFPFLRLLR